LETGDEKIRAAASAKVNNTTWTVVLGSFNTALKTAIEKYIKLAVEMLLEE